MKKGTKTILIIIVSVAIVSTLVYFLYFRPKSIEKKAEAQRLIDEAAANPGNGANNMESPNPVNPNLGQSLVQLLTPYNNATMFRWQNPIMKNERVQWMQYRYNKTAIQRKLKSKSPEWPIIKEDGIFGKSTHDAVYRVMGNTHEASWNTFKDKIDQIDNTLLQVI